MDVADCTLLTPCGPVTGRDLGEYREFRGIRYATAERWMPPVAVTRWEGHYDAREFGACCYQKRAFYDDAAVSPFYHREFRLHGSFTYSEDCLFLNIWTPSNARGLPVIVYIHGGSFTGGSGDEDHIRGRAFNKQGCILVSVNYRLGPFGFIAHPALRQADGGAGNWGLRDQLCALEWVKSNISAFGGDPERIVVMGQSAGAMSVTDLLLSPRTQGLLSGAVLLSGAGFLSGLLRPRSVEEAGRFLNKLCALAGASCVEELRSLPPQTLYDCWLAANRQYRGSIFLSAPVVDGYVLTGSPADTVRKGAQCKVPCLVSVTENDMAPAMLWALGRKFCLAQQRAGVGQIWPACFARRLPGDANGAWHAGDLPYVFGTLDASWRPFTADDFALSELYTSYLTNFAACSDPNGPGLPCWESFRPGNSRVMRLDACSGMGRMRLGRILRNTLLHKGPM